MIRDGYQDYFCIVNDMLYYIDVPVYYGTGYVNTGHCNIMRCDLDYMNQETLSKLYDVLYIGEACIYENLLYCSYIVQTPESDNISIIIDLEDSKVYEIKPTFPARMVGYDSEHIYYDKKNYAQGTIFSQNYDGSDLLRRIILKSREMCKKMTLDYRYLHYNICSP